METSKILADDSKFKKISINVTTTKENVNTGDRENREWCKKKTCVAYTKALTFALANITSLFSIIYESFSLQFKNFERGKSPKSMHCKHENFMRLLCVCM